MKRRTKKKFDYDFAYDQKALIHSLGARYQSSIEKRFVEEALNYRYTETVLDIGTGTGRFMEIMAKHRDVNLIGIDISPQMIKHARRKVRKSYVVLADADGIPFLSNIFDVVVAMRVFRYIPSWRQTIKETYRILNPGGLFIFDIANKYSIQVLAPKKSSYLCVSLRNVINFLEKEGFTVLKFKNRKRLPFPLYNRINGKIALTLLILLERLLDNVFPASLLGTDIMILAKKLEDS